MGEEWILALLQKARKRMPKIVGKAMEITMEQMQWLLSGLNIEKIKGFKLSINVNATTIMDHHSLDNKAIRIII